jgi:Coenzyme PQQ synthesis protein D (PqqD)
MQAYRLNAPQAVAETSGGEAVVINLDRGTYYSIRGTGAVIWDALIRGVPADQIIDNLAHSTDLSVTPSADVGDFLTRLIEEDLLTPADTSAEVAYDLQLDQPYAPPVLDKYSDMEALLLLDPIHDVDEAGWPNLPNLT